MEKLTIRSETLSIRLVDQAGRWKLLENKKSGLLFSGYFWFGDQLYDGDSALHFLSNHAFCIMEEPALDQIFKKMNGSWALIAWNGPDVLIAADLIRSIPVFYTVKNGAAAISDSSHHLVEQMNLTSHSPENISFYLRALTCFSGETIVKNLHDVAAGEYVRIFNLQAVRRRYWHMPPKSEQLQTTKDPVALVADMFDVVFRRMAQYLDRVKMPIFLPLSGGMDSRLLAWAIRKYKIENKVIAFTYGRDETVEEAVLSRRVAETLGMQWEFVKYEPHDWKTLRDDFPKIIKSLNPEKAPPHFQDYFAVCRLVEQYGVGLVLPGLCLDGLTGLTIPKGLAFSGPARFTQFFDYGSLFKTEMERRATSSNQLENFELFNITHKWSSYVVNSVRTYELLGCPYYLPYWDSELTDLWLSLPTALRYDRVLFRRYLNRVAYVGPYAPLLQIPIALGRRMDEFSQPISVLEKTQLSAKYLIKRLLGDRKVFPQSLQEKVSKNRRDDYVGFYDFFAEASLQEIKEIRSYFGLNPNKPLHSYSYNDLFTLYALNALLSK